MQMKAGLSELYREGCQTEQGETLDADSLARLAAGEHLGDRHDEVVAALAGSTTHAAALRTALAVAPDAEWLAGELRTGQGRQHAHRSARAIVHARSRRWQWAALAASAFLAVALLLPRESPLPRVAPVASQAAQGSNDWILAGSFEEGPSPKTPIQGKSQGKGDEGIFVDDFGA